MSVNQLSLVLVFVWLSLALSFKMPTMMRSRSSSLSMLAGNRKALMGGNWKLNPTTLKDAQQLAHGLRKSIGDVTSVNSIVFPPFPFLTAVKEELAGSNIALGAQDCYWKSSGAFTGAVSTTMLKNLGVTHVLVGHSERRTLFHDSNDEVNHKLLSVLSEGLVPVLCVGESREEYESGLNAEVCGIQLLKALKGVEEKAVSKIVVAYEPVWAIGTGLVCPSETAQQVHKCIRDRLSHHYSEATSAEVVIQYGGSVTDKNVKELMSMGDIDGCLVGGASLKVDSFSSIVNYNK